MTTSIQRDILKDIKLNLRSPRSNLLSFKSIVTNKDIKEILGNTLLSSNCNPFSPNSSLYFDFYRFNHSKQLAPKGRIIMNSPPEPEELYPLIMEFFNGSLKIQHGAVSNHSGIKNCLLDQF